jgi:hypothetical protein
MGIVKDRGNHWIHRLRDALWNEVLFGLDCFIYGSLRWLEWQFFECIQTSDWKCHRVQGKSENNETRYSRGLQMDLGLSEGVRGWVTSGGRCTMGIIAKSSFAHPGRWHVSAKKMYALKKESTRSVFMHMIYEGLTIDFASYPFRDKFISPNSAILAREVTLFPILNV